MFNSPEYRDFRRLVFGATLAALGAFGCGSSEPKTYPVRGVVVDKQTQLPLIRLAGGNVILEPLFEPKTAQVRGLIDEDGSFHLGSVIDNMNLGGALAGNYLVRIVPPDDGEARRIARSLLDRRFELASTSGLKLTVAEAKNDVKLEVEGPRQ